ncbi:MAG TPA: hypothetical protein VMS93_13750 [Candidatus Saccharimonadales bacterium]|nr:hypothetical protein [Candidatus Saccharimonadales bacterium]
MANGAQSQPRYEMVNVQMGYVVVEQERFSRAARAYFSAEPVPPKEEYWEGKQVWSYAGMGQSFQFDVRDRGTGVVTPFRELLGLLYYACCKPESDAHRMGLLAHELDISVYVAITYEGPDGSPLQLSTDKLRILNQLYNERLKSRGKKILILPDFFGLYREISYGQIAIDFGLTSME